MQNQGWVVAAMQTAAQKRGEGENEPGADWYVRLEGHSREETRICRFCAGGATQSEGGGGENVKKWVLLHYAPRAKRGEW